MPILTYCYFNLLREPSLDMRKNCIRGLQGETYVSVERELTFKEGWNWIAYAAGPWDITGATGSWISGKLQ